MGKQTIRQKIDRIGGCAGVLLLLCIWCIQPIRAAIPEQVLPGGMAFGVKFACDGVMVVGFTEVVGADNNSCMPAYDAGLRTGDRIVAVNGHHVSTSEEFARFIEDNTEFIENNTGFIEDNTEFIEDHNECIQGSRDTVEIQYERGGELGKVRFRPIYSPLEGKYKTGMWIRDTTAGIGTVTFLIPETGEFVGLGHGICDPNTGDLLPMRRGKVVDVSISGVTKGASGRPGELMGTFTDTDTGVLLRNTTSGVYGILQQIPSAKVPEPPMPLASTNEIHTGDAYIWCTLSGDTPEKFAIRITALAVDEGKNFAVQVTDPALIEKTGGIVQGMSGSPIIQDGKLIGAVTHVLISDPTRGYGIPIDNMRTMVG